MVDYKQLRAGNLLLNHKGEVHKVIPWDIWNFECMVTPGMHFDKRLEEWKYIPLDYESIKILGITHNGEEWEIDDIRLSLDGSKWDLALQDEGGDRYGLGIRPGFIHQLQNLVHSLTGNELEIKL